MGWSGLKLTYLEIVTQKPYRRNKRAVLGSRNTESTVNANSNQKRAIFFALKFENCLSLKAEGGGSTTDSEE